MKKRLSLENQFNYDFQLDLNYTDRTQHLVSHFFNFTFMKPMQCKAINVSAHYEAEVNSQNQKR